jgi:DNA-directed RNA polymerase specialized sigma24 family protein
VPIACSLASARPEEEFYDWEREDPIPRAVHSSEMPEHRVLREIFRHYTEFRSYVAQGNSPILEHTYLIPVPSVPEQCPVNPRVSKEHEAVKLRCVHCDGEMKRVTVSFNFWDLHRGLKDLAPRKREALFYNVIMDQKQKDVAKIMGITTVTVGQYVDHAFKQLVSGHMMTLEDSDD